MGFERFEGPTIGFTSLRHLMYLTLGMQFCAEHNCVELWSLNGVLSMLVEYPA